MKIGDYLRRNGDPLGCDIDFERLLGDQLDAKTQTTVAGELWAAIASGEADIEQTLRWAQHIAQKVEATVINKTERDAAPAALKAIGFFGRGDPYRGAREFMATIGAFPIVDEQGLSVRAPRLTAEEWLQRLLDAGHLVGVPKKTALNRINEWRNELGIG